MHYQLAGRLTGRVTKWIVVVFWLALAMPAGMLAAKLTDVQNNEQSSWLPGSAESTKALERLKAFQSPNVLPTVLVYESKDGTRLSAAALDAARAQTKRFAALKGVTGKIVGPEVSKDGQLAQTVMAFDLGENGWNKMPDLADELRAIGKDTPGATFFVSGQGGQAADSATAFENIDGTLLYAAVAIVILILLMTYRSPLLWLLPLVSAGVALTVAQAAVYLAAKHMGVTVNGQSQSILTVLVFGAGTDYALLLVSRYREELRHHEDRHEAMAFALHRAGPAIIASGSTVILGMLCLLFAEMNSTQGLGPVSAIGILVALLVMTTLLPALLVVTGRWIFWPRRPDFDPNAGEIQGFWWRAGERIAKRPRKTWIATTVALAIACLGLLSLDANGLQADDQYTTSVESVRGDKALRAHGEIDASEPLRAMTAPGQAARVSAVLARVEGLGTPLPPLVRGDTAMVSAPVVYPATSQKAFDVVDRARSAIREAGIPDTQIGGASAIFADVGTASARDNKVVLPAILLMVLLVLTVLLRSLVAPLVLIATVVLSFGAALGVSALVFEHIFGFAGQDQSFPLFVFVFLVALGIDYNIFLMTRVREEVVEGRSTKEAALIALGATGGVITSAGIVLAATFAVLGTLPLVFMAELAFAVAFGVLLDTLIVRSVLVTALNLDIGDRMWWPSALARRGTERGAKADPFAAS